MIKNTFNKVKTLVTKIQKIDSYKNNLNELQVNYDDLLAQYEKQIKINFYLDKNVVRLEELNFKLKIFSCISIIIISIVSIILKLW